jgi:Polyketide cyclase / dehydrase and lipid transport
VASIIKQVELAAPADAVWARLRQVGAADQLFRGVLEACRLDGDVRIVRFAGGMEVRERIIDLDDANRRVAYSVIEGRFSHHHASMQVVDAGGGRSRFLWVSDFLPNDAAAMVAPLVEQGTAAMKAVVEAGA